MKPGIMGQTEKTATDVQLAHAITATPPDILRRYRENVNSELYPKEWIYHHFPPAGSAWLDFGCGTGEITTQLALLGARRVYAVDVTPGLLQMTERRAALDGVADRVRCLCGDITVLEPESVDVALAFAVLHHIPERLDEVIGAIARWLKPGGVFIFSEPVCYLPILEWARNHSGVKGEQLDPGERKLTESDLGAIRRHFKNMERVHFHILGRLNRVVPSAGHQLRRIDATLRNIPGSSVLAGSVLGVCRK